MELVQNAVSDHQQLLVFIFVMFKYSFMSPRRGSRSAGTTTEEEELLSQTWAHAAVTSCPIVHVLVEAQENMTFLL